jgi:hypothetical protein
MTDLDTTTTSSKTLAERLAEGKIPVTEGLRNAMILAEGLRRIHSDNRAHGAVAPCNIEVTPTGPELMASPLTDAAISYAAPEVLEGRPADARSDIFSFGAVLYEILTGRAAYRGTDRSSPMPTGSPVVDKLVACCLSTDPAGRPARLQKVMLELKLLSVAASRANASAGAKREASARDAIRTEMAEMEARLVERLQSHEGRQEAHAQAMGELQRAAADAVTTLREQLATVAADVASAQQRVTQAEQSVEASGERVVSRVLESTATVIERISRLEQQISTLEQRVSGDEGARIDALETGLDALRKQTTELHNLVAQDLLGFEQALKSQAAAIESSRTAMSQTDDLVERVVEALESLQSAVLEHAEEHPTIN